MAEKETNVQTDAEKRQAALRTLQARQINSGFGQIVTLMMHSPRFRHRFVAELEWLVAPAVATNQFMIAEVKNKELDIPVPIAAVLWATISEAVDARIVASGTGPTLKPEEWPSGKIPWLIDTVGDRAAAASLVKKLAEERFASVGIKCVERQSDGKALVRVLGIPEAA